MRTRKGELTREIARVLFGLADSGHFEHEDISRLREDINDDELHQALKHWEEPVYAYAIDGTGDTFRYRGSELFGGQKATRLYTDMVEGSGTCLAEVPGATALSVRFNELWITSGMKFHWVVCVATQIKDDGFMCEYREDKGNPVDTGMDIQLDVLADALCDICEKYVHSNAPVYEV